MENIDLKKLDIDQIEQELQKRGDMKKGLVSINSSNSELANITEADLYAELKDKQRLVYGVDNRSDLYDVTDIDIINDADSVAAILDTSRIVDNGDGTSTIKTVNYGQNRNLCSNEKFREQPLGCWCSGFLVAPDLLATAGHCIDENELSGMNVSVDDVRILFGFRMKDKDTPITRISNNDIYKVTEIVSHKLDSSSDPNSRLSDYAVVRLDRPVTNHKIVTINNVKVQDNEKVHIIGHPMGLPLKYAGGAEVTDNSPDAYFVANCDSYGGNSGSPIFNSSTHEVEGILVRGQTDLRTTENGCRVSVVCPIVQESPNCAGEHITRTKEFKDHVS